MKRYLIVAIMTVTLFLPYVSATRGADETAGSPTAKEVGEKLKIPTGEQIFLYTSAFNYFCEVGGYYEGEKVCRDEAYATATSWISGNLKVMAAMTCPYSGTNKCSQCQQACWGSNPPIPIPPNSRSTCIAWCIATCC